MHARVELTQIGTVDREVYAMASYISNLGQPVASNLPLDRDVPQLVIRARDLTRHISDSPADKREGALGLADDRGDPRRKRVTEQHLRNPGIGLIAVSRVVETY